LALSFYGESREEGFTLEQSQENEDETKERQLMLESKTDEKCEQLEDYVYFWVE
jgi:hypothetical protein